MTKISDNISEGNYPGADGSKKHNIDKYKTKQPGVGGSSNLGELKIENVKN